MILSKILCDRAYVAKSDLARIGFCQVCCCLVYLIQSEKTSYKQVDVLIEVLEKKPDKMFDKFCDLLKVENSDLYDLLTAGPSGKTAGNKSKLTEKNKTESLPNELCAVMPIFAFTFNTPNRHYFIDAADRNGLTISSFLISMKNHKNHKIYILRKLLT